MTNYEESLWGPITGSIQDPFKNISVYWEYSSSQIISDIDDDLKGSYTTTWGLSTGLDLKSNILILGQPLSSIFYYYNIINMSTMLPVFWSMQIPSINGNLS